MMLSFHSRVAAIAMAFMLPSLGIAQMGSIQKFDFSELENKVLLLPVYEAQQEYVQKMARKGKTDKVEEVEAKAAEYNETWQNAMATSVYDATPYEIRPHDPNKLIKEKNEEAILLTYTVDAAGNYMANMIVTGPKKHMIATTIITGLDLSNEHDLRLMINMLNSSLNTAAEIDDEGDQASRKEFKNKYKESVIEFSENIGDMVFLVPKYTEEEYKKADKRNEQIEDAAKIWNLCELEIVPTEEIEQRRVEGDDECFYWRSFPIYTTVQGISFPLYSANFLFTCERDEPLYYWLAGKKLKPNSLQKAQEGIVEKAEKYKKQLED